LFIFYLQDFKPPPGLTGDIIKDTVLVDERVEQLCSDVAISHPDKVTIIGPYFFLWQGRALTMGYFLCSRLSDCHKGSIWFVSLLLD
jgi:hypothetical protein